MIFLSRVFLYGEETENGGAAAGHGGVERSAAVHVLLEGGDGGMDGEYRLLEVVDNQVAPFVDGLPDGLTEVGTRGAEKTVVQSGIGFLCRHMFAVGNLNLNRELRIED